MAFDAEGFVYELEAPLRAISGFELAATETAGLNN
jgi:hypothetical protein